MFINRNRPFLRYVVDAETGEGGGESTTTTDTLEAPPPADSLGDAGKKAIDAMKAERNSARAEARAAKAALAEMKAQLEAKDQPPDEQALAAARAQARAEVLAESNARLVAAEVRAAAAGRMADPTDALRLLDLSSFEVGEDGVVDAEAIGDAIADLIKSKPYLQAAPQRRPAEGSADGGTRKADASTIRQLTRADLVGMSADEIRKAQEAGQFADLMAGKH